MRFKMAMATVGTLVAVVPWAAVPAQAANIVYSINESSTTPIESGETSSLSDTIIGTITTDGTLGGISSSNIVDYDLDLIDNLHPANNFELIKSNSLIHVGADPGLSASASGLSFDFSDPSALFLIQVNGPKYFYGDGYQYFCFAGVGATAPCSAGETISPNVYYGDGVEITGLEGKVALGSSSSVPASSVPEPATWALMLTGLGLVGSTMRKSTIPRRQAAKFNMT